MENGAGRNLRMLVRSHPPSAFARSHSGSALRLSFPGNPPRTAGEDFQASCLPSRARARGELAAGKLDDLRITGEALVRTETQFGLFAGLRPRKLALSKRPRPFKKTRAGGCG